SLTRLPTPPSYPNFTLKERHRRVVDRPIGAYQVCANIEINYIDLPGIVPTTIIGPAIMASPRKVMSASIWFYGSREAIVGPKAGGKSSCEIIIHLINYLTDSGRES